MQFVENGPDLPDEMLQVQEEGTLVFFCGAGISMPAGLPDFKCLVKDLFRKLGRHETADDLKKEMNSKGCDVVLNELLIGTDAVDDNKLKEQTAQILVPKKRKINKSLKTHKALLSLAEDQKGDIHLVTTNYDCLFEKAWKIHQGRDRKLPEYICPCLPVPKPGKWNGLVYLHGKLPTQFDSNPEELRRNLVLTSSDFGIAYISEAWAARFVTELTAHYNLCFVGYSAGDTLIRYALDALAADRRLGNEHVHHVWAFCDFKEGDEDNRKAQIDSWSLRGVTAVPYADTHKHSMLHETLCKWSNMSRQGIMAKTAVANDILKNRPEPDNETVCRKLIWSLNEPSGHVSSKLATMVPPPDLGWLEVLDRPYIGLKISEAEGIKHRDKKSQYSLLARPDLEGRYLAMSLCESGYGFAPTDDILKNIMRWLLNYLNDPRLLEYLVRHGGVLHPEFAELINIELTEQAGLNDQMRKDRAAKAPQSLVSCPMKILWRLYLAGKFVMNLSEGDAWHVFNKALTGSENCQSLKVMYRRLISPRLQLIGQGNKQIKLPEDQNNPCDLFTFRIVLYGGKPHYVHQLDAKFNIFFKDTAAALREVWELHEMLGLANTVSDLSIIYMPSIEEHEQNRYSEHWTYLIARSRDDFLYLSKHHASAANWLINEWREADLPLYRRLWLFAAANSDLISSADLVSRLEQEQRHLVWSTWCKRELCRLLVKKGGRLEEDLQIKLRALFEEQAVDNQELKINPAYKQLYLQKLDQANETLSEHEDKNEFACWLTCSWIDPEEMYPITTMSVAELKTLRVQIDSDSEQELEKRYGVWSRLCREKTRLSVVVLCNWLREGHFNRELWCRALHDWSFCEQTERQIGVVAKRLNKFESEKLESLVAELPLWLEQSEGRTNSKRIRSVLAELCKKQVTAAIRYKVSEPGLDSCDGLALECTCQTGLMHPAAHVATAIIRLTTNKPAVFKLSGCTVLLDRLSDSSATRESVFATRLVLVESLPTLYCLERKWAKANVIPSLDWAKSHDEARFYWFTFLYSGSWTVELIAALKSIFPATCMHYDELGENAERFAYLLFSVYESSKELIEDTGWGKCFGNLSAEGLAACAKAARLGFERIDDQKRQVYWKEIIKSWWDKAIPLQRNRMSAEFCSEIALLAAQAGDMFPEGVKMVSKVAQEIDNGHQLWSLLSKHHCCAVYPEDALDLLEHTTGRKTVNYDARGLKVCLKAIMEVKKDLREDKRFSRLAGLCGFTGEDS